MKISNPLLIDRRVTSMMQTDAQIQSKRINSSSITPKRTENHNTLTSMMQTDENSQPSSRLMTLIADRKVWNTGGNSMDVMEAYCVMIYIYTKGKAKQSRKQKAKSKKKKEKRKKQ